MLIVPTGQLRYPVSFFVGVVTSDRLSHVFRTPGSSRRGCEFFGGRLRLSERFGASRRFLPLKLAVHTPVASAKTAQSEKITASPEHADTPYGRLGTLRPDALNSSSFAFSFSTTSERSW